MTLEMINSVKLFIYWIAGSIKSTCQFLFLSAEIRIAGLFIGLSGKKFDPLPQCRRRSRLDDVPSTKSAGLEKYVLWVLFGHSRLMVLSVIVSITLLHFLSLSSTVVRVGHRWRTRRAWWDDYIVIIPWCLDIIYIVTMWAKYKNHGECRTPIIRWGTLLTFSDISWDIPDPSGFIYSAWFDSFLYFSEIWYVKHSPPSFHLHLALNSSSLGSLVSV